MTVLHPNWKVLTATKLDNALWLVRCQKLYIHFLYCSNIQKSISTRKTQLASLETMMLYFIWQERVSQSRWCSVWLLIRPSWHIIMPSIRVAGESHHVAGCYTLLDMMMAVSTPTGVRYQCPLGHELPLVNPFRWIFITALASQSEGCLCGSGVGQIFQMFLWSQVDLKIFWMRL